MFNRFIMKTIYFGFTSLWLLITAIIFSQNLSAQVRQNISNNAVVSSTTKSSMAANDKKIIPIPNQINTKGDNFHEKLPVNGIKAVDHSKGAFSSWQYYNAINIDNTGNPNTLTDYSVLVIVNTYDLIAAGKMNIDGSDIRFTTDFSDNLSYWVDPGIQNEFAANTATTHVWVKIPVINASSSTTVHLVYGNQSAGSESNIATTFLMGDDFDDNSLDAAKWNVIYSNSGQVIEQNQRLEHHSPATNPESEAYVQSIQSFTEPVVLEMNFMKGGYVYRTVGLSMESSSWTNSSVIDFQDYGLISVNTNVDSVTTGNSYSDQYWSTTYDPEYYLSITRKPDGMFHYSVNVPATQPGGPLLWENDIVATMPLTTPLNVFTRDHVWYASANLQLRYEDNIRVRKYTSHEPAATLSMEQMMVSYCTLVDSYYGACSNNFWITDVTTSGGVSDFSNPTDCSVSSYSDYSSSKIASNYQGATTTLSFTSPSTYPYYLAYSVWIDFNDDLYFDVTEQVIADANSSNLYTLTSSFVVPVSANPGTYRMRVRADYNYYGAPTDPCAQLWYGESEDYGFTVLPAAAPSTINLTFNVDMTQPINVGDFIVGTDTLYVTGTFANAIDPVIGWDMPGTGESFVLTDDNNDKIFTGTVAIDTNYGELKYKYFKNATWNFGDNVTGDRIITIDAADFTTNDVWIYPAVKPTALFKKASTAPIVDGSMDAVWAEALTYTIDKPFQTNTPTLGVSGSTTWKALWTNDGIYILLTVTDDVFFPAYMGATPLNNWEYDKPEIYFDVNPILADGIGAIDGQGHYQVSPPFVETEIDGTPVTAADGVINAFLVSAPNYVAEYFVPFSKLFDNTGFQLQTTDTIGFDVTIIDRDNEEIPRQRAVWANVGAIDESYFNMDGCGTATFDTSDAVVLVTSITVSSVGNATTISADGGTLQMSALVLPENTTYPIPSWSVINETGKASIDANGLLTAKVDGTVTVVATAKDGTGITGSMQITLSNQVVTLSDVNIIKNGRFATDGPIEYPWATWSGNGGTASVVNGVCTMVPVAAAEVWQLHVNQSNWVVYKDTSYMLTFTAWSDAYREINIDFEDEVTYNRFGASTDADAIGGRSEWIIALTTTPTVYKRYVTFDQLESNTSTKFNIMPSATSEIVYIDDISLVSLGDMNLVNIANLFAGGSGSQADPYLISTPEHLNNVRFLLGIENAGTYFSQIANIDLGVYPWNNGEGWEPIGNKLSKFYGNYNGNNNFINGLTINRPDSNYVALFGWAIGATLTNIRLENANIAGNQRVAPLVARLQDNGHISNCYASGNSQGQMFSAGLVANLYFGSTIDNSSSSVNVQMIGGASSHQQAGGLISRLINSSVDRCFSTGKVEGVGSWFGGLVGLVTESSTISNSYATGDVIGNSNIGGLIGEFDNSSLANCYSVGRVTGDGAGGLVGLQYESTATNCYWNIETSAQITSALGEPKNTLQMITSTTFIEWPFSSIWTIYEGSTYPFLQWQGSPGSFNYPPTYIPPSKLTATPHNGYISLTWQAPSFEGVTGYYIYRDGSYLNQTSTLSYDDGGLTNYITYNYQITAIYSGSESSPSNNASTFAHSGFSGGDGSEGNPYLISNAGELFTVRLYLDANFKQIANIDLGVYPWNYNEGWQPIGKIGLPFTGAYNGDGNTIYYLTINRPYEQAVGLFGSINNGAVLENVILESSTIAGEFYVGTIAGDVNNSSTIRNVVSNNSSISGNSHVGGITGGNFYNVTITKSHSTGSISAITDLIGGISGLNYDNSNINTCYSSMSITSARNFVGGISGSNEILSSISNSYFIGNISGNEYVGGIVGINDSSTVKTSYSMGYIAGSSYTGGLVGESIRNGTVTSSYWNTETSGQGSSAGGEGRTSSEMIYPYSNTYLGWDFNYIWANDADYTINNGYPYLRMLDVTLPTVTTSAAESITLNSAIVRGNVTTDGGLPVTARGMVYSTTPNPSIESNEGITNDGQGVGEFISTLNNLTPSKIYYVKAYATNGLGTSYGTEVNFTTLDGGSLPTVSTNAITSITTNTAKSGGNVTADGGSAVTARGVVWSINPNPSIEDNSGKSLDGQGIGAFVSNLSN